VLRTYTLLRPVFAYVQETRCVVQLPSDALITLVGHQLGSGAAVLRGEYVWVFAEDVEENGLIVGNGYAR
jgi:hypothetical protein